MSSLFKKRGRWWIRYEADGKWKSKPTPYRIDNLGESAQARRLCKAQANRETTAKSIESQSFSDWVPSWLEHKYGHLQTTTPDRYLRMWRRGLAPFLKESGIDSPAQIQYSHAQAYIAWRLLHNGKRNTAIGELKLMSMIIDESVRRGICQSNPVSRLRLSKDAQVHKTPWNDDVIYRVGKFLDENLFGDWLHVTFLPGLFQARRLRECAPRLDDLKDETIRFMVKGQKVFVQPIDVRIRDTLEKIS